MTPANIPQLAIIKMTVLGATFEPIEEFKKLTASLLTPTTRSNIARMIKIVELNKRSKKLPKLELLIYILTSY